VGCGMRSIMWEKQERETDNAALKGRRGGSQQAMAAVEEALSFAEANTLNTVLVSGKLPEPGPN